MDRQDVADLASVFGGVTFLRSLCAFGREIWRGGIIALLLRYCDRRGFPTIS
jgi:predicted secreted protein